MQMAIADPDRFVLKPQLEGGGKALCLSLFCQSSSRLEKSCLKQNFAMNWWKTTSQKSNAGELLFE